MLKINIRELMATLRPDLTEAERARLAFETWTGARSDQYADVKFADDGCGFAFKVLQPVDFISLKLTVDGNGVTYG